MEMEAINNYVKDVSYEIIRGDYDEFVKWNGYRCADSPAALEIGDNVAVYYILLKDGKFKSDFLVFPMEGNNINVNKWITDDEEFVFCLNYLKGEYKYLTMSSCEQLDNSASRIRKYCKVVDENIRQYNGYDGKLWRDVVHKVSLKDDK